MACQIDRQTIIDYLESCGRGGDMGRICVSQDFFILDEDGESVPFEGYNDRLGVCDIFKQLSPDWPGITLGAGSQLRLVVSDALTVAEVQAAFRKFAKALDAILEPVDYSVSIGGCRPDAAEGSAHLDRDMAGLQMAINYADEADAVRKLRIATLLSPILALLADNSPVFGGEANVAYLRRMTAVQQAGQPLSVPGLFDAGFGFGTYADQLLDSAPELADDAGLQAAAADLANAPQACPTLGVNMLTSQMDPLPIDPMLSLVAMVKGLFYGPLALDLLEHMLRLDAPVIPYNDATVSDAVAAIAAEGFDAQLYGRSVDAWIDMLFRIAPEGLGTEFEYLEDLKEFKGL